MSVVPVAVSYPRSGLSWFRYATEYLTGRPTPGRYRIPVGKGKDWAFYRCHVVGSKQEAVYEPEKQPPWTHMLLILRDPVANYLRIPSWDRELKGYSANIKAFEKFKGEKMLVYYEDVQKSLTVYEMLDFMHVPYRCFCDDTEEKAVRADSLKWYKEFNIYEIEKEHPDKTKCAIELTRKYLGPQLYKKYLRRYDRDTSYDYVSDQGRSTTKKVSRQPKRKRTTNIRGGLRKRGR